MATLNDLMNGLQPEVSLGKSLLQQQDGIELSQVGPSIAIEEVGPSPIQERVRRSRLFGLGATFSVLAFIVLIMTSFEKGPTTTPAVVATPPRMNPVASKPVFQVPDTTSEIPQRANSTFLPSYTLQQIIGHPGSPQSRALEWVESFSNFRNIYKWRRRQLLALGSFYYSTGGPSYWPKAAQKDWMSTKLHECSWQSDEVFDPKCAKKGFSGRYINLELKPDTLQGTLPPELALLTSLTSLVLHDNPKLEGSIPQEWSKLSLLRDLNLSNNQLTGTLPSQIGLLTSIASLHLADNQLSGEIPSTLFTELSNLETLFLHNNRLSGTVSPSVCYFSNLKEIWVDCEAVRCACAQCRCAGEDGEPQERNETATREDPWHK